MPIYRARSTFAGNDVANERADREIKSGSLEIKHPRVLWFLYESEATTVINRGLTADTVKNWTVLIARGEIPEGFSSLDDFEAYVLTIIETKSK